MDAKPATFSLAAAPVAAPAASASASKPKPCCVCKDEKSRRDECMLFSTAKDPAADCRSLVDQYKSCMQGFGFTV
ncbi:hypothetical protein TrVGV298_008937 [Trichoderma virens]|nr:hypothetical protein TrVGV298_008937 [Trichoderma virens]